MSERDPFTNFARALDLPDPEHALESAKGADRALRGRYLTNYRADHARHDEALADGLPLPRTSGVWPRDFSERVDAYQAEHACSRAEVFRRIAAISGNAISGLSLRYYRR